MSAYIESKEHIDTIVSYFCGNIETGAWMEFPNGDYNHMNEDNAHLIAEVLNKANVDSVNYRYSEKTERPYEFTYREDAKKYSIPEIALALSGYEYQSCEMPKFQESYPYRILALLRKDLLRKLEGYDEADTWSIGDE